MTMISLRYKCDVLVEIMTMSAYPSLRLTSFEILWIKNNLYVKAIQYSRLKKQLANVRILDLEIYALPAVRQFNAKWALRQNTHHRLA